jgi:hypothetical protein
MGLSAARFRSATSPEAVLRYDRSLDAFRIACPPAGIDRDAEATRQDGDISVTNRRLCRIPLHLPRRTTI